jgi:hypothetical protein
MLAIAALLCAIALVIHEASQATDHKPAPIVDNHSVSSVKKPVRPVVPDSITLDKSSRHRVVVNPYVPESRPTAMRTVDGNWSSPETVYETSGLSIYVPIEDTTTLLGLRPTENWFTSSGFAMLVLKDYAHASANLRNQVDANMEGLGIAEIDRKRFRFVDEAVFINMVDHSYTVVGRKYIDRNGETILTMDESFRAVSNINASAPDVDEIASWTASGIVHDLHDRQKIALDALRSSGAFR